MTITLTDTQATLATAIGYDPKTTKEQIEVAHVAAVEAAEPVKVELAVEVPVVEDIKG